MLLLGGFRGLESIKDREVCCYMISCKDSINIDVVIDWLIKHSKTAKWSMFWLLFSVWLKNDQGLRSKIGYRHPGGIFCPPFSCSRALNKCFVQCFDNWCWFIWIICFRFIFVLFLLGLAKLTQTAKPIDPSKSAHFK